MRLDEDRLRLAVCGCFALGCIALLFRIGGAGPPAPITEEHPHLEGAEAASATAFPVERRAVGAASGVPHAGSEDAERRNPLTASTPASSTSLPPLTFGLHEATEDTLADWAAICGKDPGVARDLWPREDVRDAWKTICRRCDLRDYVLEYFARAQVAYVAHKDPAVLRTEIAPALEEIVAWGVAREDLDELVDVYQLETMNQFWMAGDQARAPNIRWRICALLDGTPAAKGAAGLLEALLPDMETVK